MPALIDDYRLVFIWTEPVLDVLRGALPAEDARLPAAVQRELYIEWLNRVQGKWPAPGEPVPPWPPYFRQGFWQYYLGGLENLESVTGRVAWRQVVPVRLPSVLDVSYDPAVAAEVRAQGFGHRWGVALTLEVTWRGQASTPEEVMRELFECRTGTRLRLGGKLARLSTVAADGLAAVRSAVFGTTRGHAALPEPYSVFAALRGQGAPSELDPFKNEGVHRLIQAAASFSPTWQFDELVDLVAGRVARRKQQPASHFVFGTSRGRSIWGPAYLDHGHPKPSLGCQQRNLVFATLQAESISDLARASDPDTIDGDHAAAAHRGVEVVGGLYLGGKSTYKTGSVRQQLSANGGLPAINALREKFRLDKL